MTPDNSTSLRAEFEKICSQLENGGNLTTAIRSLREVKAAVQALQEEGFSASLDIRPYGFRCPVPVAGQPIANGTIGIDDIGVDFVIALGDKGNMRLLPYLGQTQIGTFYLTDDLDGLRPRLSTLLLQVKAHSDAMRESNVPENGAAKLAAAKLPPKLKAGAAP